MQTVNCVLNELIWNIECVKMIKCIPKTNNNRQKSSNFAIRVLKRLFTK